MANAAKRGYTFPCFKDKVVIVTGASSGIGEATAIEFAKDGAKLALTGRNAERLNGVAQKCIAEGVPAKNILQFLGDITDDSFIERLVNETASKLGGINVLVNNAGFAEMRGPGEFDKAKLDGQLDIFVRSLYTTIKFSVPHLKKTKGSIVNISSIAASAIVMSSGAEYGAAKSAMNHLSKNFAYEFAHDGVRINTVSPGVIRTPILDSIAGTVGNKILTVAGNKTGFKRAGIPTEVASAVQFLSSPAASYITGTDTYVDGGLTQLPLILPEELQ